MLPLIQQAITLGYTTKQILDFVSNKIKGIAGGVQNSRQQGYSDDDILKFIGGKFGKKGASKQLTENEQYLKNAGFKTKGEREETRGKFIKGAFQLGSAALGGYALNRALPKASSALQGQLLPAQQNAPIGQGNQLPGPQQTINVTPQSQGPRSQPQLQSQQAPKAPQAPIQPQQAAPTPPTPKGSSLPQALQEKALTMLRAGNPVEKVSEALKSLQPKIVKEYEKATGQPIDTALADFASSYLPPPGQKPDSAVSSPIMEKGLQSEEQQVAPQEQTIEQPGERFKNVIEQGRKKFDEWQNSQPVPEPTEYMPKKEKGSTVALPNGEIGEITNIRQGIATVNANGKEYRRKVEELDEEPEDVIETVSNLLKIPEIDKSSIVSLFTFDPEEKKMYIQYHNGESYKYLDIDPEKVNKVASKMGIPVTEGKNIYGAWSSEDKNSLGAALIKEIVNDPKYKKAKKGEKPNPNYVKLETLYDYWQGLRKKPKRKGV